MCYISYSVRLIRHNVSISRVEISADSSVKIILYRVHVRFMKRVDLDYSSA